MAGLSGVERPFQLQLIVRPTFSDDLEFADDTATIATEEEKPHADRILERTFSTIKHGWFMALLYPHYSEKNPATLFMGITGYNHPICNVGLLYYCYTHILVANDHRPWDTPKRS